MRAVLRDARSLATHNLSPVKEWLLFYQNQCKTQNPRFSLFLHFAVFWQSNFSDLRYGLTACVAYISIHIDVNFSQKSLFYRKIVGSWFSKYVFDSSCQSETEHQFGILFTTYFITKLRNNDNKMNCLYQYQYKRCILSLFKIVNFNKESFLYLDLLFFFLLLLQVCCTSVHCDCIQFKFCWWSSELL